MYACVELGRTLKPNAGLLELHGAKEYGPQIHSPNADLCNVSLIPLLLSVPFPSCVSVDADSVDEAADGWNARWIMYRSRYVHPGYRVPLSGLASALSLF